MKWKIDSANVWYDEAAKNFGVTARDAQGRIFYLMNVALPLQKAISLSDRVRDRGEIDLNLWHVHIPYGTEAWLTDGMEQRQIEDEREGFC